MQNAQRRAASPSPASRWARCARSSSSRYSAARPTMYARWRATRRPQVPADPPDPQPTATHMRPARPPPNTPHDPVHARHHICHTSTTGRDYAAHAAVASCSGSATPTARPHQTPMRDGTSRGHAPLLSMRARGWVGSAFARGRNQALAARAAALLLGEAKRKTPAAPRRRDPRPCFAAAAHSVPVRDAHLALGRRGWCNAPCLRIVKTAMPGARATVEQPRLNRRDRT